MLKSWTSSKELIERNISVINPVQSKQQCVCALQTPERLRRSPAERLRTHGACVVGRAFQIFHVVRVCCRGVCSTENVSNDRNSSGAVFQSCFERDEAMVCLGVQRYLRYFCTRGCCCYKVPEIPLHLCPRAADPWCGVVRSSSSTGWTGVVSVSVADFP